MSIDRSNAKTFAAQRYILCTELLLHSEVLLYLTLLHQALGDNHSVRDVLEKHNFISSLL